MPKLDYMLKPDKFEKFLKAMLTMFGIGYFKNAPGTLASFVTCVIYFLIYMSSFSQLNISLFLLHYNPEYVVWFLIIITISSINLINDRIFTDKFAKLFKKKDPKEIVIDEFIGQSIPIIAYSYLSFFAVGSSSDAFFIFFEGRPFIGWLITSFILFRFFDILKPFPINIIDKKMKNGLGIMLDDIIAGIYSTIAGVIIWALWF